MEDVRPAFDLALRMFIKFQLPDYEPQALAHFKSVHIDNEQYIQDYTSGKNLMYIALDGEKIVGMINEHGTNRHISEMAVDGEYHRRGIATELMNRMVCELKMCGVERIELTSSPYGLPFYLNYGFTPTENEKRKNGFIYTPMAYEPNEIWDVLDKDGNKTGRLHERGRKMAANDYHLEVFVWVKNDSGEYLISQRSPNKTNPNMWECTGGNAVAGDDSLTTALKEVKEELGIVLEPQNGRMIKHRLPCSVIGCRGLIDVWLFRQNIDISTVILAPDETCNAMWATTDKIREMMAAGEFVSEWFYPYFDEMMEKWGTVK
jgi:isopentenyldiphosphate isomerase/GNAT superfamily N-acetyltransferase